MYQALAPPGSSRERTGGRAGSPPACPALRGWSHGDVSPKAPQRACSPKAPQHWGGALRGGRGARSRAPPTLADVSSTWAEVGPPPHEFQYNQSRGGTGLQYITAQGSFTQRKETSWAENKGTHRWESCPPAPRLSGIPMTRRSGPCGPRVLGTPALSKPRGAREGGLGLRSARLHLHSTCLCARHGHMPLGTFPFRSKPRG